MLKAIIARTISARNAPSAHKKSRASLPNRDPLDPDGAACSFIVYPRRVQRTRRSVPALYWHSNPRTRLQSSTGAARWKYQRFMEIVSERGKGTTAEKHESGIQIKYGGS